MRARLSRARRERAAFDAEVICQVFERLSKAPAALAVALQLGFRPLAACGSRTHHGRNLLQKTSKLTTGAACGDAADTGGSAAGVRCAEAGGAARGDAVDARKGADPSEATGGKYERTIDGRGRNALRPSRRGQRQRRRRQAAAGRLQALARGFMARRRLGAQAARGEPDAAPPSDGMMETEDAPPGAAAPRDKRRADASPPLPSPTPTDSAPAAPPREPKRTCPLVLPESMAGPRQGLL